MKRSEEICKFLENDFNKNVIIEPNLRAESLKFRIFDVIKTYNPEVIIKAGLGEGALVCDIAEEFESYIVVVEESYSVIEGFREKYKERKALDKIKFINGNFTSFPVDYYAANLLICADYLDFNESGKVIDEFRRALDFESVFFLGAVVLNDDDLNGIYDDFIRLLFPLHNDYYLAEDLKTFMKLNEFKFIKGNYEYYNENINSKVEYFNELFETKNSKALSYIEEHEEDFIKFYDMKDNIISEPYYTGVFIREKPDSIKGKK